MTLIGYTMMCEQTGPKQLVRDVAVISDRYGTAGFWMSAVALACSRLSG